LGPTRLEDGPAAPAPPTGIAAPLRVRLLGAAGETLAEVPVTVREAWSHHDGARAADGVRFFRAELPFDDGAQRWVLDENGRELASFDRSASAPTVRIDPPPSNPQDPFELRWSGSDPDGDPLRYSVHYSADGQSWRALALHAERSSLAVDPALLEAGPEPALRVTASDGFHRAEARVSVAVRPRLDVWMTWPLPDEPVSESPTIQVVFRGEPVFDVFDARTLALFMADGNEIPGETVVDEGGRRLVFAPLVPLPPDTEFRVVMRPGLVSTDGARLTEPVSWTFRTGGG
ncbi:MAG: hypothetical protein HKN71_13725, partial [Gemmatimonadetes bacterium]|nr:hypothetical protein [Gemmatimonadota bacterium]